MRSDTAVRAFFSKQDLRRRWSVSLRTVERLTAEGALGEPVMIRQSPRYPLKTVENYERAQHVTTRTALTTLGPPSVLPGVRGSRPYFSLCIAHIKGGVGKTTTSIGSELPSGPV